VRGGSQVRQPQVEATEAVGVVLVVRVVDRPGDVTELRDIIEEVVSVLADADVVGPTNVVGEITVVVGVVVGLEMEIVVE